MNPLHALNYYIAQIPASAALGIELLISDAQTTVLKLPITGNTNHHDTVFGGSLSLAATLAGWACAHQNLPQAQGNIVIKKSQIRYLAPANADVWVLAQAAADDIAKAHAMLQRFGRSSLVVVCQLWCVDESHPQPPSLEVLRQGRQVASFEGDFVAVVHAPS